MRFLELLIEAYGPFTDLALDLAGGREGLHVIYGMNEAGKSSALRAVHAFLFGIPAQTKDNFVHSYPELRIGARLRDDDGEERVLWRRKGNRDTLLDASGEPVAESVLGGILGGITDQVFADAFGMDHDRLVRGGEVLLAGGGEIGQSLFAAGLGSADLRELLTELESECDELFKGGAAKRPRIDKLIGEYRRLQKGVREASLAGSTWTEHQKALERAEAELARLETKSQERKAEYAHLDRLERALPKLAERHRLTDRLTALAQEGPLPALREGFEEERRSAERALEMSREQSERAAREARDLGEELDSLVAPEELVARAPDIDELYQEVASHRKAARDRITLEGKLQIHRTRAEEHLVRLRASGESEVAEPSPLPVTERRKIQELADRHAAIASRLEAGGEALAKRTRARSSVARDLEARVTPRDPAALGSLSKRIRGEGDLEGRLAEIRQERRGLRGAAEAGLGSLGGWKGTLEEVEGLAVPDATTVDRFESLWDDIQGQIRDLERRGEELDAARHDIEEALSELELVDEVPTEDDLRSSRARREEGWRLIRRAWLDDERIDERAYDPERPLPEAFERAVSHADGVADVLRRDAKRVARKAHLILQREQNSDRGRRLGIEKAELEARRDGAWGEWEQQWSEAGIAPHPPREMRAWLRRHAELVDEIGTLRLLDESERALIEKVAAHREALRAELHGLGDETPGDAAGTLAADLDRAETRVAALEREARTVEELRERLRTLDAEVEDAEAELRGAGQVLDVWRGEWGRALQPLALDAGSTPGQLRAFLEVLDDLQEDRRKAEEYASRIQGIERDALRFAQHVEQLVGDLAPELSSASPEKAIRELHRRAAQAAEIQSRCKRLAEDRVKREEERDQARDGVEKAGRTLTQLCREVGVASPEELPSVEVRAREAEARRSRIVALEGELLRDGKGAGLAALEREAEGVDGDALAAQLPALREELEDLDRQRAEVRERIGEARQALAGLRDTAGAAHCADEAESVASSLRNAAERFVRLKLARAILQREIESYRSANQGPLLERASEIFARVTCGAFASLRSDYAEDGGQVLVGVRPGGGGIPVSAMSDGTREQLYLALRLASLEQHLETGTAIPLVVDDILLRSDDARSRAILEALADLSGRTQVLFFTHQSRYVDLAEQLDRPGVVFVQRLSPSANPDSASVVGSAGANGHVGG